jgi:hypothetical protein
MIAEAFTASGTNWILKRDRPDEEEGEKKWKKSH